AHCWWWLALTAAWLLAACEDRRGGTERAIESIAVKVMEPSERGTREQPLRTRDLVLDIELLGAGRQPAPIDRDLQLYTWFLGSLGRSYGDQPTPENRCTGLQNVHVERGAARGVRVTLPQAFGPVTVWVEDCREPNPSWATGASDLLWFPYPTI